VLTLPLPDLPSGRRRRVGFATEDQISVLIRSCIEESLLSKADPSEDILALLIELLGLVLKPFDVRRGLLDDPLD
jgi:hypothetical protein